MYSEKQRLIEKRENPFYGSYKEHSALEELHWQNRKKRKQLGIVAGVVVVLILLAIGIALAITLPDVLERNQLVPPDPVQLPPSSQSLLLQYSNYAISSESQICSDIGRDILETENGSSVVDAAVAMSFCLGVVCPQASGIGGGFFMTLFMDGEIQALSARETAPLNAHPAVFANVTKEAMSGGLFIGVPGEVLGLWAAHEKFGRLNWSRVVEPARKLAEQGFTVDPYLAQVLGKNAKKIKGDPGLSSQFLDPSTKEVWVEGDVLVRPTLGETLRIIETEGALSFYNGSLTEKILKEISDVGGIFQRADLENYSAEWEVAVELKLNNSLSMYSLPFPSSGPLIALGLGMLERFGRKSEENQIVADIGLDEHRLAEVLKFVHAHRGRVADPNFVDLTNVIDQLLSSDYQEELVSRIEPFQTFKDPRHYGGIFAAEEDFGTSQISIIGRDSAVSLTTTINLSFGSGVMGETTGIIYNNEMADFSFPDLNALYGLKPNPDNFVEPGKRPGSSMAPLIFLNEQLIPVLATGGSGGTRIPSSLVSTTWRALFRELDIKSAIDHPRFIPTFDPPILHYEFGLPASTVRELKRRGHSLQRIQNGTKIGNINAACKTKVSGILLANADFRKNGGSAGL